MTHSLLFIIRKLSLGNKLSYFYRYPAETFAYQAGLANKSYYSDSLSDLAGYLGTWEAVIPDIRGSFALKVPYKIVF